MIECYHTSMNKFFFILLALFVVVPMVYAEEDSSTPFGASCPLCDTYGYCQKPLTYTQAVHNLKAYYARKRLNVIIVKQFGRFLEADVYKEGKMVEKVILDRRTGRIRSIY